MKNLFLYFTLVFVIAQFYGNSPVTEAGFIPLDTVFDNFLLNFKNQCQDLSGFEEFYQLLKNIVEDVKNFDITDLISVVAGNGDSLSKTLDTIFANSAEKAYKSSEQETKFVKKALKEALSSMSVMDFLDLVIRPLKFMTDNFHSAAAKAQKEIPVGEKQYLQYDALITCLGKSLVPQATLDPYLKPK